MRVVGLCRIGIELTKKSRQVEMKGAKKFLNIVRIVWLIIPLSTLRNGFSPGLVLMSHAKC